jgi:hypothetical protein
MSENHETNGEGESPWERDAQELRALLETGGYTQAAAAAELECPERSMRGFCSGREQVPRSVLYAVRWLVEHKPIQERWLQVHWKKLNMTVSRNDKFQIDFRGGNVRMLVNGQQAFLMSMKQLLEVGIASLHTSYSSDRFLVSMPMESHESPGPVDLHESIGVLGYRLNLLIKADGDGGAVAPPSVEFFAHDGRSRLSAVLMVPSEIDYAVESLARNARVLGVAAKRAMSENGGW